MRGFLLTLLLSACTGDWEVKVGELSAMQPPTHPATIVAGEPFAVMITTVGDGCTELERTDVDQTPDAIRIVPFDRHYLPGNFEGCTDNLLSFAHDVTLTFETPGAKKILVRDLDRGSSAGVDYERIVDLEFPVTVEMEDPKLRTELLQKTRGATTMLGKGTPLERAGSGGTRALEVVLERWCK